MALRFDPVDYFASAGPSGFCCEKFLHSLFQPIEAILTRGTGSGKRAIIDSGPQEKHSFFLSWFARRDCAK
ncbi:MAG: hypothetical protein R3D29_10065 [Nitratireductor sp.]